MTQDYFAVHIIIFFLTLMKLFGDCYFLLLDAVYSFYLCKKFKISV